MLYPQRIAPLISHMQALEIQIRGIVQGVGFRPFVWRLANSEKLTGFVRNESWGVVVHIQGQYDSIGRFLCGLKSELPPAARIDAMKTIPVEIDENMRIFSIIKSLATVEVGLVPPDLAVCADCIREMLDESDNRYLYPFINCTNCGPRFTIVQNVPYDRPSTTMSDFRMCDFCRGEYENPENRRYHAQPVACPRCGPEYFLTENRGAKDKKQKASSTAISIEHKGITAIQMATKMLCRDKIIAVQGIGGFHLMCDAANSETITRLRKWKNRPTKPFAIMAANIETAATVAKIDNVENQHLMSPAAPILLLGKKYDCDADNTIAPGLNRIGLFLPYAPVHYLLFNLGAPKLLLATSGNRRDEPIAKDPDDAIERLDIADAVLWHNRKIHNRADDSVGYVLHDKLILTRRARGYIPHRYPLPKQSGKKVLAAGADMKGAVAVSDGKFIYPSQYIGEMTDILAQEFWCETVDKFLGWLQVEPDVVICDLHPDYHSTRLAREFAEQRRIPMMQLQHHKAHAWAMIAEHSIQKPVIAAIMDGTGLGDNGNEIWGGEFFFIDPSTMKCIRCAALRKIVLPGGDAAAVKICRMAYAYLIRAFGDEVDGIAKKLPMWNHISDMERHAVDSIFAKGNSPFTTSAGRLFDAAAAIAGVTFENEYEAYAPMRLQAEAEKAPRETNRAYKFQIKLNNDTKSAMPTLDFSPAIRAIAADVVEGVDIAQIAMRFHCAVAQGIAETMTMIAEQFSTKTAIVAGGVFQNRLLLELLTDELRGNLRLIVPEKNPPNDAGVALGQAYWAASINNHN